ncbi:MAG: segregation/condensation protein A [Candidatus Parcubacteria bacterium]|nr:segregation/condensation protein A [Candidatus Parcubacteria bacterium]
MEQYKVQLESWQGPLDLLLHLIESQELDITKVSLATVADQFIAYMNANPNLKLEETADFLVVAAKLIYIKSKALLPTLEIEDEGIDLEKQLKMYKEYIEASKKIHKILRKNKFCFSKEKFPEGATIVGFHAPKSLTVAKLQRIYEQVIKRIKPIIILPQRVIAKAIKLSERIQQIKDLVLKEACTSFNKLICDSKTKTEKIVSFLAVLELVKQKILWVEQDELFKDITLKKIDG